MQPASTAELWSECANCHGMLLFCVFSVLVLNQGTLHDVQWSQCNCSPSYFIVVIAPGGKKNIIKKDPLITFNVSFWHLIRKRSPEYLSQLSQPHTVFTNKCNVLLPEPENKGVPLPEDIRSSCKVDRPVYWHPFVWACGCKCEMRFEETYPTITAGKNCGIVKRTFI